ncbi:MAG: DUF4350 domain-containing protein [Planctomycetaceae bacterium]
MKPAISAKAPPRTFWSQYGLPLGIVLVIAVVFGLSVYFIGNQKARQSLAVGYGRRDGTSHYTSVNGTRILAEMFRKRGDRVSTITRLTPKVAARAQIIVWFPDDFEPPTQKQREFFENWLGSHPYTTLVYVGRDYNAAPEYWRDAQAFASPADEGLIAQERAFADSSWQSERAQIADSTYGYWFTVRKGPKRVQQGTFDGQWEGAFDPAKAKLTLSSQLAIPVPADLTGVTDAPQDLKYTSLLSYQGDQWVTSVTKEQWSGSEILVVSNGSFLLNYPLVNPEHRKLAQQLVDYTSNGSYSREVVFLQSNSRGPQVYDKEPEDEAATTGFFRIWPINVITFHLILLGMFYCVSRSIMFGRPRDPPLENPADFGRHITALGELMQSTDNIAMAEQRISHYEQQAKRASGKSHRNPGETTTPSIATPTVAGPLPSGPVRIEDLMKPRI